MGVGVAHLQMRKLTLSESRNSLVTMAFFFRAELSGGC